MTSAVWSTTGIYLALDTSGPTASVALARGRDVLAREFLRRSDEQARRIVPAIEAVLARGSLTMSALTGIVVGAGPGSFTGVRIAAATAKGLVHALGIPLWSSSSLAAGAFADRWTPRGTGVEGWWKNLPNGEGSDVRYVLFDARGDRIYAACFRARAGGGMETLAPPHATTIEQLLASSVPEGAAFAGDGAVRHKALILSAGHPVLGAPAGTPTADALIGLLSAGESEWIDDPARWEPFYLKASNAERETRVFDARRPEG